MANVWYLYIMYSAHDKILVDLYQNSSMKLLFGINLIYWNIYF